MRHLMTATQDFMRECGLCYCGLMGSHSLYGGSLGWRPAGDKLQAQPRKYISPVIDSGGGIRARADWNGALFSVDVARTLFPNTPTDLASLETLSASEAVGRAGVVSHRDGANLFELA